MALVTTKEMFEEARRGRFAIGAFNADNMEMVQAITEVAEEERAPLILQVGRNTIPYTGLSMAANMVKTAAAEMSVPVALHQDHGRSFEQSVLCVRAGFTSLMFDGSRLPYEENVAITAKVTEMAHALGIPVEAELGRVLSAGCTPEEVEAAMTDPDQAAEFVERTGCNSLAAALGSIHGMRSSVAELDIERVRAVSEATGLPLVLHGGSGVSEESVLAGIENGICKVNVATYLKQGFTAALRSELEENPELIDLRKYLAVAREGAKERVRKRMRMFRCNNRIDSTGGFRSPATHHQGVEVS
jgi:fructose-bisphosphate aldolase class II